MYLLKDKRKVAVMLKMDHAILSLFSVFVGHGYLQQAGAEYVNIHKMRYHVYIFPDDVNL